MLVRYNTGRGKKTVRGLRSMDKKKLIGRLKLLHSGVVSVGDKENYYSGVCKPLQGKERAIFLVLEGSEVRVGTIRTEFFLGIRIDIPGEMKTCLVCKCGCLSDLSEAELRFHGVRSFIDRINKEGHLPKHEEVPRALLDVMKHRRR